MKISTETESVKKYVGDEKAIEYIKKAGFDAYDFSMYDIAKIANWNTGEIAYGDTPIAGDDYLKYARSLKKVADDCGIYCNQTHSVFPTQNPKIEKFVKRTIECTAELGAKICVVHPLSMSPVEDNVKYYNELLPFAKECGVKIATENMWAWSNELKHATPAACSPHGEFLKLLEEVNDDYLIACLDIGHAEMLRQSDTGAVQMIKTLGKHLQSLHIHDNDQLHDSHQIPFSMSIDFEAVVRALKEINYSGEFTLEANSYLNDCTADNVFDKLCDMRAAARKLADMYETL